MIDAKNDNVHANLINLKIIPDLIEILAFFRRSSRPKGSESQKREPYIFSGIHLTLPYFQALIRATERDNSTEKLPHIKRYATITPVVCFSLFIDIDEPDFPADLSE